VTLTVVDSTDGPSGGSNGITMGDVANLPVTLRAEEVASLLRCSVWTVYELVKAGTCPAGPPIRVGRSFRWSTAEALRRLSIS
jgi:excisionase family DNA binding protein